MHPILLRLTTSLGFDPVHFGIIMGLTLAIGGITPPLGVALMTTCRIIKIGYPPKFRDFWPFFVTMVLALGLLIMFPGLVLWLADLV